MTTKTLICAVALAITAAPVFAQQLDGADVTAKFTSFNEDNGDVTFSSLSGGIDYSITPSFAIGGHLSVLNNSDADDSLFNATLHGMYMVSPTTALGVFVAQESIGDADAASYGIEGGFASQNAVFEAYYGIADEDGASTDQTIAGIGAEFSVGSNITLGIDYEALTIEDGIFIDGDFENATLSDTSVSAGYMFADGFAAFVEIGRISVSASSGDDFYTSEDPAEYITIGAEYKFGRGTIFDNRSVNVIGR